MRKCTAQPILFLTFWNGGEGTSGSNVGSNEIKSCFQDDVALLK